jgi:hypothetical protein
MPHGELVYGMAIRAELAVRNYRGALQPVPILNLLARKIGDYPAPNLRICVRNTVRAISV